LQWYVDCGRVKHHVVPDAVAEEAETAESRFIRREHGTCSCKPAGRGGWCRPIAKSRVLTGTWPRSRRTSPRRDPALGRLLHGRLSKNKAAAWKFIEFATRPPARPSWSLPAARCPSLKAVAESAGIPRPECQAGNSKVYLDTIPYIRAVPVLSVWVDIESMGGEELERAFYGNASLDEVIQAMITRSNDFFAKSATP